MMNLRFTPFFFTVLLAGCSSLQPRGSLTVQGRGAQLLTQRGDALMDTGIYAKKDLPKDFVEGYAKGINDQLHREYFSHQAEQALPGTPAATHGPAPNPDGKTNYYQMIVPEHTDEDGVNRVPRSVTVPIVEFITRKGRL
jgi:hypothetical protein